MAHSDWYKNRDESEVKPLAQRIYSDLRFFFSDENARCNKAALGKMSNRIAHINAYVDFAEGHYMVYENLSNYKRGCSFWGFLRKQDWPKSMTWCENKAREILHLNTNN